MARVAVRRCELDDKLRLRLPLALRVRSAGPCVAVHVDPLAAQPHELPLVTLRAATLEPPVTSLPAVVVGAGCARIPGARTERSNGYRPFRYVFSEIAPSLCFWLSDSVPKGVWAAWPKTNSERSPPASYHRPRTS